MKFAAQDIQLRDVSRAGRLSAETCQGAAELRHRKRLTREPAAVFVCPEERLSPASEGRFRFRAEGVDSDAECAETNFVGRRRTDTIVMRGLVARERAVMCESFVEQRDGGRSRRVHNWGIKLSESGAKLLDSGDDGEDFLGVSDGGTGRNTAHALLRSLKFSQPVELPQRERRCVL